MEEQQKPMDNKVVRILVGFAISMLFRQLFSGKKRSKRKATLKSSDLRGVDLSKIKLLLGTIKISLASTKTDSFRTQNE